MHFSVKQWESASSANEGRNMDNLPKQISEAFLGSIIADYSSSHKYDDLKVDISLLAHAYFGMYRNPRYSADWVAHKYMFIDAANKMSWRLFEVLGRG